MVSVITAVVVDLYPTQYRAMAIAVSLMSGRLGAVTGSHVVGYMLEYVCPLAFYFFGFFHIGKNKYIPNYILFFITSK